MTRILRSTVLQTICLVTLFVSGCAYAQLYTFSPQDLMDYTAKSPFDRLPDGRPKVPDPLIERARDLSSEEVWAGLREDGFRNQYADGFQVLHPGKTMVGRAFTVQFMPMRASSIRLLLHPTPPRPPRPSPTRPPPQDHQMQFPRHGQIRDLHR